MRGFEDEPIDWAPASVWTNGYGVRHQSLKFIVPGRPAPKGSVIKTRYGVYHDTAKGIDDWLAVVSHQARAAMFGYYRARNPDAMTFVDVSDRINALAEFSSAVLVDALFVLPRPKSTVIDGVRWNLTKPDTPPHIHKPDGDKLLRAICDAMTGIVYLDDNQVIDHHARKRYAYLGESTGAIIMVTSNVSVT